MCAKHSPLPVKELPCDSEILRWLAVESAYMISATGTRCVNVRAKLRGQAIEHGLCRGAHPVYADIAVAMEKRFGASLLDFLGYPAWTNGSPSAWIRRLFRQNEQRSPSIIFLFSLGLFNSSVEEFERAACAKCESSSPIDALRTDLSSTHLPLRLGQAHEIPDWAEDLPNLLTTHSFRLSVVANRIGVNTYSVAAESRRQGIRLPLSKNIAAKLGHDKLERIRRDLGAGIAKIEVARKHRASGWAVLLVELDSPNLSEIHKCAAATRIRNAHRQKVLDVIRSNPNASRDTVAERQSGAYDFMLGHDKRWFYQQFPQRKRPDTVNAKAHRSNRTTLDNALAQKIRELVGQMKSSARKPEWITKSGVLRRTGSRAKYLYSPTEFPETGEALKECVESYSDFLGGRSAGLSGNWRRPGRQSRLTICVAKQD